MANASDLLLRTIPVGNAVGEQLVAEFPFTLANGDNIASTHDIGKLPAGLRVLDADLYISDGGPASSTLDIGFKSLTGTNQDDPDFLFAVVAAVTPAMARKTVNNQPFTLVQDMYLRVTVQGANQNGTFAGNLVLKYQYIGTP